MPQYNLTGKQMLARCRFAWYVDRMAEDYGIAFALTASGPLPIADPRPLEAKLVTNKRAVKTKVVRRFVGVR